MEVDILDPFSQLPCGVPRMTFHMNLIALGHYSVTVMQLKKGM
jgi:hypothetical protein